QEKKKTEPTVHVLNIIIDTKNSGARPTSPMLSRNSALYADGDVKECVSEQCGAIDVKKENKGENEELKQARLNLPDNPSQCKRELAEICKVEEEYAELKMKRMYYKLMDANKEKALRFFPSFLVFKQWWDKIQSKPGFSVNSLSVVIRKEFGAIDRTD
ncbi:hypothetical protein RFI_13422, partial [Reticulomyxa filosa]